MIAETSGTEVKGESDGLLAALEAKEAKQPSSGTTTMRGTDKPSSAGKYKTPPGWSQMMYDKVKKMDKQGKMDYLDLAGWDSNDQVMHPAEMQDRTIGNFKGKGAENGEIIPPPPECRPYISVRFEDGTIAHISPPEDGKNAIWGNGETPLEISTKRKSAKKYPADAYDDELNFPPDEEDLRDEQSPTWAAEHPQGLKPGESLRKRLQEITKDARERGMPGHVKEADQRRGKKSKKRRGGSDSNRSNPAKRSERMYKGIAIHKLKNGYKVLMGSEDKQLKLLKQAKEYIDASKDKRRSSVLDGHTCVYMVGKSPCGGLLYTMKANPPMHKCRSCGAKYRLEGV